MDFKKVNDEKIKNLAKTLRSNELAMSDSEALRMAEEMTSTADKVQKSYDSQEESPETETLDIKEVSSRVADDLNSKNELNKQQETEVEEEVSESKPSPGTFDKEELFEQQKNVIKSSYGSDLDSDKTVKELMNEDATKVYSEAEKPVLDDDITFSETSESKTPEIPSEPEPESVEEPSESEQQPESPVSEPEKEKSDDGFEVDETKEIKSEKKSDEEREKEAESMAESKVDLSDVFNFGSNK